MQAEQRFAVFYAETYRLILTVAQQRVGDLPTAQDITSEVFRVAWIHHCDGGTLELPLAVSRAAEHRRPRVPLACQAGRADGAAGP